MKLVVVGGHARKAGKTLVVSGIIRGLKSLDWTAVKITPHFHGVEPIEKSAAAQAAARGFQLTEEKNPLARGDTGRYLAAGARRALLLRVQPGSMPEALPALRRALGSARFVIMESNSILNHLKPAAFVFVLAGARRGIKASARRFLRHADALAGVGPPSDFPDWRGIISGLIKTRPTFLISSGQRFNPHLCQFLRRRLARAGEDPWPGMSSPTHQIKEQLWLH
jgi:hypothetical protein